MLHHLNMQRTKPSRVLVIGSGGFVGNTVVQTLQSKGIAVRGVPRQEIDLLQEGAVERLAALVQPQDALVITATIAPCKNAEQLIDNLQMLQAVCQAIQQKAADISHVIYVSSDAVYADDVALAKEDSKQQPSSFHGMMHAARELMIKSAAGKIPVAILRPSVLFGLDDPHNGYGPNRFFRLALQDQKITFFGGGEEQRDHIYIQDVAEIVSLVLLHRSQGVLNIATGESHSFKSVAEQVLKTTGKNVVLEDTPRQNAVTHRHFDITACRTAFPDFYYTSLVEGLQKVHAQYLEQTEAVEA